MTEEIVFYHNPQSRSQMAHWMLEEAAAPYKIVPIDFAKFSAADVYIGSEIRFAMMFGASGLKGEKVFDDYVARLSARPAAQCTAGG
jgi:glutathione S-transferase